MNHLEIHDFYFIRKKDLLTILIHQQWLWLQQEWQYLMPDFKYVKVFCYKKICQVLDFLNVDCLGYAKP